VAPAPILKESLNGTGRNHLPFFSWLIANKLLHSNGSADNFDPHSNARDSNASNITEVL
jgi:hypothetical protein